jgi:hypothetical protein
MWDDFKDELSHVHLNAPPSPRSVLELLDRACEHASGCGGTAADKPRLHDRSHFLQTISSTSNVPQEQIG